MRDRKQRKAKSGTGRVRIVYAVFLLLYSIFVLLDAFVIPRNIVRAFRSGNDLRGGEYEPIVTDDSYDDGTIRIRIKSERIYDTTVYIADGAKLIGEDIQVGKNSSIWYNSVIRCDENESIVIGEGTNIQDLSMIHTGPGFVTAEELAQKGAQQIFSFGPALVDQGEVAVIEGDEVERAQITNPRTAIGILDPLHYLMVVSDGRTAESRGLSLFQLAELMQDEGCETAYNLDGGGSSTIWFNGRVLNKPTTYGDVIAERTISDIVYIGY